MSEQGVTPRALALVSLMTQDGYTLALCDGQMWEADFFKHDEKPFAHGAWKAMNAENAIVGAAKWVLRGRTE